MSLPITAVGPLKVLTNPIFTDCWAAAGAAPSATNAAVPIRIRFMSEILQPDGAGDLSGSVPRPKALPAVAFRLSAVNVPERATAGKVAPSAFFAGTRRARRLSN